MMSNLVYLIILLVVVIVLVNLRRRSQGQTELQAFPYRSKEFLMSPAERSFLGVLDQVLSKSNYRVFAQVRLADIVQVDKGLKRADWQRAFNTISRKHVDYVVCKAEDMAIVGAVELDDESHQQSKRRDRDQILDNILEAAGIPLARVKAAATYSPNEILNLLFNEFSLKLYDNISESDGSPINQVVNHEMDKEGVIDSIDPIQNEEPKCPKCGSPLLPRVAKKGKYQGQKFWGCSQFPICKYAVRRV